MYQRIAHNPNAAATAAAGKSKGSGRNAPVVNRPPQDIKPGDWQCLECNDWQFARNTACRLCGTPNTAFTALRASHGLSLDPVDVEGFLAASGQEITKYVADQLRSLTTYQQRCVINRGDMTAAVNPTAVLRARIKDVVARHGD